MSTNTIITPKCVGTTRNTSSKIIAESYTGAKRQRLNNDSLDSNQFSDAQFSADGTSVVTQCADHCLRTFVLSADLLDGAEEPHHLVANSTLQSPSPIQSYACYPHFNLQDASTTVFLSASNDLPISLTNALYSDTVHAKYPLINPTTEEYIAPSSLLWTQDGTRFIAGSRNQISIFDSARNGAGPVLTHKTAAGRKEKTLFGGQSTHGCKGVVTALKLSSDGILAAGTRERQIGLYAQQGSGECLTSFSVASSPGEPELFRGTGIMHVAWSPNGTYLLVAERQSDVIQVYDVRNTLGRLAWLGGRRADTTQRLGIDVVPTANGYEVWAGGKDGCVRMWQNPGSVEGEQEAEAVVEAHNNPVSSTVWHPGGAVFATCFGRREVKASESSPVEGDNEGQTKHLDSNLKIWTL